MLISDEFTNPLKRRAMMEKRSGRWPASRPPSSLPSTDRASRRGRHADRLGLHRGRHPGGPWRSWRRRASPPISFRSAGWCRCTARRSWRSSSARSTRSSSRTTISGQFARYLRSETSFVADGHIRKYDGEPFMPHHIVEAVKEQLAGKTTNTVRADARNHGLRGAGPMADQS